MDFVPLLLLTKLSIPTFYRPPEMKPERKEEEGEMMEEEDEGKIPEEEPAQLENGENAEDNESGSTDSGQENSGEPRLLRSGTYSDRTESKAYGSVTHKCEVRPAGLLGSISGCPRDTGGDSARPSIPRTAGRSSPTPGTSSGTSVSTPERSPSPAGSATRPSPTQLPARPTRRRTGMGWNQGKVPEKCGVCREWSNCLEIHQCVGISGRRLVFLPLS